MRSFIFQNCIAILLIGGSLSSRADDIKYFELTDTVFEVGSIHIVDSIVFDFDLSRLRPESTKHLDKIVDFMKRNINLTVEVGVHSDCRGNDNYNTDLTFRRAKSVSEYVISKGIELDRFLPKGYGEVKPHVISEKDVVKYPYMELGASLTCNYISQYKSKEKSEQLHQLNRRVELKILSLNYSAQKD